MKNGEFKIDTKAGVVAFCQASHGKEFISTSKVEDLTKFNIGIGQLIAMKRNELKIRKADLKTMLSVVDDCNHMSHFYTDTTGSKLWSNFVQLAADKISMSRNHVRELNSDLTHLYNGTYNVKPYAEILEDKKLKVRDADRPYSVPQEVVDGTHVYKYTHGSIELVPLAEADF